LTNNGEVLKRHPLAPPQIALWELIQVVNVEQKLQTPFGEQYE
jgi:hypothetical protein